MKIGLKLARLYRAFVDVIKVRIYLYERHDEAN